MIGGSGAMTSRTIDQWEASRGLMPAWQSWVILCQDVFWFLKKITSFYAIRFVCDEKYKIKPGDRIAQMIISSFSNVKWKLVDDIGQSKRGNSGFGSTGSN